MAETQVLDYRGRDTLEVLGGGALSGIVAGLVMALAMMVHAAVIGIGFFLPMKLVAASLQGVTALVGDVATVLLGLGIHLALSALWGIGFALFVRSRTGLPVSLMAGVVWGMGMWLVMTWGFLPYLDPVMYPRTQMVPWAWASFHLVYGVVLGLAPILERALVRAAAPEHAVVRMS